MTQEKILSNVTAPVSSKEYLVNAYGGLRLGVVGTGTYTADLSILMGPDSNTWIKVSAINLGNFTVSADMNAFTVYEYDITQYYKFKINVTAIEGSIDVFASMIA